MTEVKYLTQPAEKPVFSYKQGGDFMAWWSYILVFVAGASVGALLMGICAYDRAHSGKKWWEDDNE